MRILHVLYSGLGGHGNVFFSLVRADVQQKFEYQALFNGIEPVRSEYMQRCNQLKIPFTSVLKSPGLDFNYYKQLYLQIKAGNADVVFVHSSTYILPAFLASLFAKKKCRIIVRETQANHLKTKQEWFWLGVALVLTNKIVFLSEAYNLQVRRKFGFLFNSSKAVVIPNGIDLEKFQPKQGGVSIEISIGMQSRLVAIKDHRTLIAAFNLLQQRHPNKRFKLSIAGDGECMADLTQYASTMEAKNQIFFTGLLSESALVNFMYTLDIYVHASFGETMSTAIMQAMACGLPVLASDVNGINNMIMHELTGILVPVKNVEAMAAALEKCVFDKEFSKRIASNASRFAIDNYANSVMFNKYLPVFYGA